MPALPARPLSAAALVAGLALTLTGCAAGDVQLPTKDGIASAAAADEQVPGEASDIVLPEFPTFRVPDISALSAQASATQAVIASAIDLPPGLEVTGARCDGEGVVVNRSGATVGGGDDGSEVITRAGVSRVEPDGSGQVVGTDVVYTVNADGSGTATSAEATLTVHADGSGQYIDGGIEYRVNADGSGSVANGANSFRVVADGSGQWVSAEGVIENSGNGSGTWIGSEGPVVVNGDGTGTLLGDQITVAPMPKFTLLGRLPKLATLGPIGTPCGTLIRISAGLLFDFDRSEIRPDAQPVLAAVATALSGTSETLQVNGHTDAKGSDAYNLDLSDRRAQAVVDALTSAGLRAPMVPEGYGEAVPVAPNTLQGKDNPAGRQLNRRVEIVVPNG